SNCATAATLKSPMLACGTFRGGYFPGADDPPTVVHFGPETSLGSNPEIRLTASLRRFHHPIDDFRPVYFSYPVGNARPGAYKVTLGNMTLFSSHDGGPTKFVGLRFCGC